MESIPEFRNLCLPGYLKRLSASVWRETQIARPSKWPTDLTAAQNQAKSSCQFHIPADPRKIAGGIAALGLRGVMALNGNHSCSIQQPGKLVGIIAGHALG